MLRFGARKMAVNVPQNFVPVVEEVSRSVLVSLGLNCLYNRRPVGFDLKGDASDFLWGEKRGR